MLVRFTLENWMSFRDPVTFSMIGSLERGHNDRIPRVNKYRTKILPIAAIYGGNASGKTCFFNAFNFAQKLIVDGTKTDSLIPVRPFVLNCSTAELPSIFSFEILIDEMLYEYSFSVTKETILEERVTKITSSNEITLYHRYDNELKEFDTSGMSSKDELHFQFIFDSTRQNQLFLTNLVSFKFDRFKPIYDWFKKTLVLIHPTSNYQGFDRFTNEEEKYIKLMAEILQKLDTGINSLKLEDIDFSNIPLDPKLRTELEERVKGDTVARMMSNDGKERFVVTNEDGELKAQKLVSYHIGEDGKEVQFEIKNESDGSRRILDLLPAILNIYSSKQGKVYIIDELDRSLHTLLTKNLLELYLELCSQESRHQIIFTTHDVMLMDQNLLRRDEMWIAERDYKGASNLLSFIEYKDVRVDKDIRKSYLQGRLGGIPKLLMHTNFEGNSACE